MSEIWGKYDYNTPPVEGATLTDAGWEIPLKGTAPEKGLTELIVAVGTSDSPTVVAGQADIVGVGFVPKDGGYAQGDTLQVKVVYNENVDVTAGATLTITSTGASGNFDVTAAEQNGENEILFEATIPSETADLSIGAQTITGTITDSTDGTASDLDITSALADETETISIA